MGTSSIRRLAVAFAVVTTSFFFTMAGSSCAADFALRVREPGPGHRLLSYWWEFNGGGWELIPPAGFTLAGGGEMRLARTDEAAFAAVCRQSTAQERALSELDDAQADAARAAGVRTLLPAGCKDVSLVSQAKNPLPVNGLTNFEVVYEYTLGGMIYRFCCMVSQGGEASEQVPPVPGQPTPAPTPTPLPRPDGRPVRSGDFFTTVIVCPREKYPGIYSAFQQLLATAKVKPGGAGSDSALQYSSHGMLGR